MKIDRVATAAQHYKDPKSYRTLDGREVLAGKDWVARKYELWERCNGRCEHVMEGGVRCSRWMDDAHHIVSRHKRRDDGLRNLAGICRHHHSMLDKRKPRWTAAKEATA